MRHRFLIPVLLAAACSGGAAVDVHPRRTAAAAPTGAHTVVVWATASLRAPFTALARLYEREHPGATVELRCEGGAALLKAALAGGQCDVLAIGDSSQMSRFAAAAYLAPGSAAELARNRIAIATRPGNPAGVHAMHDLVRPGLRVALGARSSSIGRHTRWVLSREQLEVKPAVERDTADDVLAAVTAGEADAGVVYVSTLAGARGTVDRIDLTGAENTPALYSISIAREAAQPRGAAAFHALALGPAGQALLHAAGFLPIGDKRP